MGRVLLLAVLCCLGVYGCRSDVQSSGPFSTAARVNPDLDSKAIQRSYRDGFSNDFIALSGSQLNQDLIISSFEQLMTLQRASLPIEELRDNFTSLGYFQQASSAGIAGICNAKRNFVGLVAALTKQQAQQHGQPTGELPCGNGQRISALPLGHDAKIFAVSAANTFINAINLAQLAKASQAANGNLHWSDLNPDWPQRRVQWIVPAQMPFSAHLQELGIQLPAQFTIAADYTKIFEAAASNPDALIFSFYSPSLNARLQGNNFKLLAAQANAQAPAINPTPQTISSTYPQSLETDIVLYINESKPNACIAVSLADYLLSFNQRLLLENNMAPLDSDQRQQALKKLDQLLARTASSTTPFCLDDLRRSAEYQNARLSRTAP